MVGWCLYQQRGDSSPLQLGDVGREEEDNHKGLLAMSSGCSFQQKDFGRNQLNAAKH